MAYEDEEQLARLREWWSSYGTWVVAGVLIGALALFGWRSWDHRQQARAVAASDQYIALQQALESDPALAQAIAEELVADYARTPYAALAALRYARERTLAGELAEAARWLEQAMALADGPELQALATLRLAEVRLAQDEPQAALELVSTTPAASFDPLYAEVRGDALLALDDSDGAREAYRRALVGSTGTAREFVQLKLNALPVAADPTEPATDPAPAEEQQ
jgi:predicted negative regulator of RcsB-dependent stress response